MPFTLLAHQAPILPLKILRPHWFSSTALVIGSIAPDLEYLGFTEPRPGQGGFTHSLIGQFVFCLPLTLSLTFATTRTRSVCALGERLGIDLSEQLRGRDALARASMSALVGSFSHIILDALPQRFANNAHDFVIRHGSFVVGPRATAQLTLTIVLGFLTIILLRYAIRPIPICRDGRISLVVAAILGTLFGAWRARHALREPEAFFEASVYRWGYLALHVTVSVAALWLLVGTFLARKKRDA